MHKPEQVTILLTILDNSTDCSYDNFNKIMRVNIHKTCVQYVGTTVQNQWNRNTALIDLRFRALSRVQTLNWHSDHVNVAGKTDCGLAQYQFITVFSRSPNSKLQKVFPQDTGWIAFLSTMVNGQNLYPLTIVLYCIGVEDAGFEASMSTSLITCFDTITNQFWLQLLSLSGSGLSHLKL